MVQATQNDTGKPVDSGCNEVRCCSPTETLPVSQVRRFGSSAYEAGRETKGGERIGRSRPKSRVIQCKFRAITEIGKDCHWPYHLQLSGLITVPGQLAPHLGTGRQRQGGSWTSAV